MTIPDPLPPGFVTCPLCHKPTRNGPPIMVCDRCAETIWWMVDITKNKLRWQERDLHIIELQRALAAVGDGSIVYYIRFGDRVKIGTTRNLVARLEGIPHDEVLITEPGDREVERQRHGQFRHLWVMGEWFRYEAELAAHVRQLRAAAVA